MKSASQSQQFLRKPADVTVLLPGILSGKESYPQEKYSNSSGKNYFYKKSCFRIKIE